MATLLAPAFAARAADLDYSVSLLRQRQPVYEEGVELNYREAVLPRLTPRERVVLKGGRTVYPLDGPDDGLFGYHSCCSTGGKEIVLPVKSLRFLSDLCVASVRLWARGYSQAPSSTTSARSNVRVWVTALPWGSLSNLSFEAAGP